MDNAKTYSNPITNFKNKDSKHNKTLFNWLSFPRTFPHKIKIPYGNKRCEIIIESLFYLHCKPIYILLIFHLGDQFTLSPQPLSQIREVTIDHHNNISIKIH
ncbi:hypothetical protein ACB098_05G191200 [Castanea mollissima]